MGIKMVSIFIELFTAIQFVSKAVMLCAVIFIFIQRESDQGICQTPVENNNNTKLSLTAEKCRLSSMHISVSDKHNSFK